MSEDKAREIAMLIAQNERQPIAALSDAQIGYYLADRSIDETPANIQMIRNA